ncbi:RNA methyltransferase [Thiotrichales bacterium 19S9-12]|nr:RNA methyltransferase [Thiotrichales bacterium 19S9-11]MCF6812168.1 RNA methyltransferase [Thiotrichales bacterium 19S9-12]
MLEKVRIILVEPSHMGNIGSSARAMMNMGLKSLYLVNPKEEPGIESHQLASGASQVLTEANICSTLAEALEGVGLVIGTSARARKLSLPIINVREAATEINTFLEQASQSNSQDEVAILFGRERTGLYNEEILMCHKHLYIPASKEYNSLNLAQAVQIIAYEVRMAFRNKLNDMPQLPYVKKASQKQYEGLYDHLSEMLVATEFLDPANPGLVLERVKRIFQRAQLEESEIHLLRGIIKQVLTHSKN